MPPSASRPTISTGQPQPRRQRHVVCCGVYRRPVPQPAGYFTPTGCRREMATTPALNPIAASAGSISGFDMNSFHNSPVRWFSIMMMVGARFRPIGTRACRPASADRRIRHRASAPLAGAAAPAPAPATAWPSRPGCLIGRSVLRRLLSTSLVGLEPRSSVWAKAGAKGGSRTPTAFRPLDPKSSASASSATLARELDGR